ncbi:MAG: cytochrome c3 family protein, partial [Rhodoferax sp.]
MNKRLLVLLALFLSLASGQLWAQGSVKNFDHVKTGFALAGMHANARCESCHVSGVFKGTPKECATCHTQGNRLSRSNMVKPATHFATPLGCDSCHSAVTFTGAKFDHKGIAPNACGSCHNGSTTAGKPSTHIQTQASCGSCHKTSGWLPASGMDHSGFTSATNCASCHNGGTAAGKTAAHMPTSLNCASCHATTGWKPTTWNHSQMAVANQCSSCHTGGFPPASGLTSNHIPYKSLSGVSIANCDSCHKGGYGSWNPGQFHANVAVSSQCATCHLSSSFGATARPATAIHNGQTVCENCHKSTSTWQGSKPDHSLFNSATNCSSCHNGSSAAGKSATHMPTSLNCASCHGTAGWKPTTWNHSQMVVSNQCATCHTGGFPPASGLTSNHIPYKSLSGVSIANCDSCHKGGFSSWNPGAFHANVQVTSQCGTCHLNSSFGLTARPATAIHNGMTACENCHKSTNSWLGGAKPDHSRFSNATNCTSCHNGSGATGKVASHIPTSANCVSCHSTNGWKPTKWNHSQMPVANQCASCHTGGFPPASGLTANHIPYKSLSGVSITNCDSCHKGGYSTWSPGQLHANVSVSTQCATCHMSTSFGATARPATAIHNGQTVCENCHKSTSTWLGSKPDHNTFTSGTNCASCHNGSAASGKTAQHMPTSINCASCHSVTGWKPTKWNHSQMPVSSQCSTCHSGAYPPADGKTANHIPYQSLSGVAITNCDSCHKAGYGSWNPGSFHTNVSVSTQCASCHMNTSYGQSSRPATAIHNGQTVCENCHKSTSTWLGSKPDHSLFTAATNCSSCHNG